MRERVIKSSVASSIEYLITEAEKKLTTSPALSKRYAKMAWDLVKKNKVRLTDEQKKRFCRKCFTVWVPGKTLKITYDHKTGFFTFVCRCGYTRKFKL